MKKTILENLPDEVTPIIYTSDSSEYEKSRIKSHFSSVISPERIKIATLDRTDRGFWARDGIPVPTISKDVAQFNPQLSLVDARYYYPFEPDQVVAQLFQAPLISHEYYFEGGNFMANRVGDCLIVNKSATQDIPDSVFEIKYGCVTLLRLPHVKGIGHADESVKFVNDTTVFTDTEEYIPLLRERGFEVVRLPRAYGNYETYVNSLIINGVVFVPIFDQSTDEEAIEIYERFGFTVIPINTETLSNNGLGSIHCISMTYPPSSYQDILRAIGAKELN